MIPTFDQLLRPLLAIAAEKKVTRRTATEEMVAQFRLSQTESSPLTPRYPPPRYPSRTDGLLESKLIEQIPDSSD